MNIYNFLSRLDFVAREVAEAVVGGVFVEVMKGGEVEDFADDMVEGFMVFDEGDAVVDEFRGDVANDVDAEDLKIGAVKDEF